MSARGARDRGRGVSLEGLTLILGCGVGQTSWRGAAIRKFWFGRLIRLTFHDHDMHKRHWLVKKALIFCLMALIIGLIEFAIFGR